MRAWHRYATTTLAGLLLGGGTAWLTTGKGMGGGDIVVGPWSTALNYGTGDTDALTRAAVARRGLLALPSSETLYWNAATDSAGRPLDGSCTYRVAGGGLDARWWSITYYDQAGYLVANPAGIWSFSSASLTPAERAGGWAFTIAPARSSGHWLPSARNARFELTLRMYNPGPAFRAAPARATLPVIERGACA